MGKKRPERLLCEHAGTPVASRHRWTCPFCGSFWDRDFYGREFRYDASYPRLRQHLSPIVGRLKARTLERWLARLEVPVSGRAVCEVGFGSGFCLCRLKEAGARVFGIEVIEANLRHARSLGVSPGALYEFDRLPARLPEPAEVWLFQDSFEHLPDPSAFAAWMLESSSARAEILIVAPRADSLSARVMGRWWPHKMADHLFHWSRAGLLEFWEKRGFHLAREFYPWKLASPGMVAAHIHHILGDSSPLLGALAERLSALRLAVPLNMGELGFHLRRGAGHGH